MATLTENFGPGEALVYDVFPYSREEVTILSGQDLAANSVLGLANVVAAIAVAASTNAGDGTMGAITLGADAMSGVYRLVILEPASDAGDFMLIDPSGNVVGYGTVASAFASTHLSFTLADGATDFAGGDAFAIYTNAVAGVAGGSNTGNGTLAVVQANDSALPGAHVLTCTAAASDAGTFSVVGPDGVTLGSATVGTEFRGGGLKFTIADGSTDFIVGDTFTVTITANKMKLWNPANTDGSSTPAGVLIYAVDASLADTKAAAVVRHAVVNPAELVFYTDAPEGAKREALTGLAALGIVS